MKNLYATFLCLLALVCSHALAEIAVVGDRAVEVSEVAGPANVPDTGYHVFLLVINAQGKPAQVARHYVSFAVKEECEATIPAMMVKLQMAFDMADDPTVRGNLAVADGKCLTDAEAATKA